MLAIFLYKGAEKMVAWVIYSDVARLRESWMSAGWTVADVVQFDNPWPNVVQNVAYVGQHPADQRNGR